MAGTAYLAIGISVYYLQKQREIMLVQDLKKDIVLVIGLVQNGNWKHCITSLFSLLSFWICSLELTENLIFESVSSLLGLGMYATWVSLATLLNTGIASVHGEPHLEQETASYTILGTCHDNLIT